MKSITRIVCVGILLFISHQSIAQIAWNEISPVLPNPAAGETSPQSYDVSIADDGRIYATYISNTAGNYAIFFKEYVPGTGWNLLFTEQVYSGFEAIHSFKNGANIMVMVKHDDASALQFFTIYNINAGAVTNLGSPLFEDIPDGAAYKAVLSESGTYIYLLHMNDTGSYLNLTQIDWMEQLVVSLTVPTASALTYNYDLVEHQDTVYIGLTHESATAGEYRTYLHKATDQMVSV